MICFFEKNAISRAHCRQNGKSNFQIQIKAFSGKSVNEVIAETQQAKLSQLSKIFPSILFYSTQGEWVIKSKPEHLVKLLFFLKHHTLSEYNQLIDLSAVDYPERKHRFEVVYFLLSLKYNKRISITVSVQEGQAVDSAIEVFPAANWYERETWDRFGVFFNNHPDLRRRLTDYGFKGHPLRKDFPVTGYVEVRYDDFRKRVLYEGVSLAQEFRLFNIDNSWKA